ncbi:unnamed protein product [Rotaria socialis]|uniref:Uncharacterized protein n=1 Tax=Rotaria socialis TaxID=392032 RepID=A0A821UC01_9BILA|nr:unnamed protein product [Rotaria socialis]CAF4887236.1 unnamed protein product [Rotaria socialis]
MTKELLNEVTFTIGLVDRLLHKKQEGEALKELATVITTLHKTLKCEELMDVFIMACTKRINVNHKKRDFEALLFDVRLLEEVQYDIYSDEDIFLMKMEAQLELQKKQIFDEFGKFKLRSKRIEVIRGNINIYDDADGIFSRENKKQRKRKNYG